ncbi:MAG: NADH-quinone oxidoreductase subunit L, partial [Mucilaginibacter sp.]
PVFAILTTWLTAFYVIRLIVKVFFGDLRLLERFPAIKLHIGDGGWHYAVPLLFLAAGSIFPIFSFNPFSYEHSWLYHGMFQPGAAAGGGLFHVIVPVGVNVFSILVIYAAYTIYAKRKVSPFSQNNALYRLSANEWYFDAAYKKYIITPVLAIGRATFRLDRRVIDGFIHSVAYAGMSLAKVAMWTDSYIIDGFLNLIVAVVQSIGNFARRFQGGKVQYYIYSMLVVILVVFILTTVF